MYLITNIRNDGTVASPVRLRKTAACAAAQRHCGQPLEAVTKAVAILTADFYPRVTFEAASEAHTAVRVEIER